MRGVWRVDLRGQAFKRSRQGRVRRSRDDARPTRSSEEVGFDGSHLGRIRGCCYLGMGGILASGASHLSGQLVKLSGSSMCLYNEVRFPRLPELYDIPKAEGAFSVSHYNENVRRYTHPIDAHHAPAYLMLRDKSSLVGSKAGHCKEYVRYSQPRSLPAAVAHFIAVSIEKGDDYVRVMGDSAQNALRMRKSVFATHAGELATYVFAAMAGAPPSGASIWPYVAKGGGGAHLSTQCKNKTCVECGRRLFVGDRRCAAAYGLHRSSRVKHAVKVCGDRERVRIKALV